MLETSICGMNPTKACDGFLWLTFVLGAIKLTVWTISFLWWLWENIYRCKKDLYAKYGSKLKPEGTWALVTGGSDGIGLEMCEQFASQGFNIVMMARNA
jgi:hypothetical protein